MATGDRTVRGKLQIYFDSHHYELTEADKQEMADGLDSLAVQVANFPLHDLRILVERNTRSNDFSVKLTLLLPGKTLVGSDHDPVLYTAFDRVRGSLEENVRAYKDQLDQVPERQKQEKHTHQDLQPLTPVDADAVERSVEAGDYPAFRVALAPYEDGLRLRAGRWVERYPAVQARMGRGLEVIDVVEEVFLAAFEGYATRPQGVRIGEWLDGLIDPAVRAIEHDPDGELENINMARSACEVTPKPA